MKVRKILCQDPVEDQEEEALAAAAAEAVLEEVAAADSAAVASVDARADLAVDFTTIITAPISVGAGDIAVIITTEAAVSAVSLE